MTGVLGGNPPELCKERQGEVAYSTDPRLREDGVLVAFSQRGGGVSGPPYASLDLAVHTGDDPSLVDTNRELLLDALGLHDLRARLTLAEQVHGAVIHRVRGGDAGSGAYASSGRPPIPATDALITTEPGIPLLMCFADCVPVVLVAPGPAVAVVHAGWRGALAALPGEAVARLGEVARCDPAEVLAYVGPHICPSCYQVGEDVMVQFLDTFGTVARADSGGLDLGAVVHATLTKAGVPECSVASLGVCTAEATNLYFSHRAEGGRTGRHGALVCITP